MEEYPPAPLEALTSCGAKLSATANSVTMNLRFFISGLFLSLLRYVDFVIAGPEKAKNLAGENVLRLISGPFSDAES